METASRSIERRDAFAAAAALLMLGLLWVILRLYWQGALLLASGVALGYFGGYRTRSPDASAAAPADASPQDGARAKASSTASGRASEPETKRSGRKRSKKRKR